MMITTKGQVTIPKEFRDLCGLQPHTEVEFVMEQGKLVIKPASQPLDSDRGKRIVEHLTRFATPGGLSADEIMAMTRGED